MCGFCYTRHGITRPCFATDTLLDLHHARLPVCHAVCWSAAACHGKGGNISTSTDRRVHGRQVLRLYRVQRLQVMGNTHVCHPSLLTVTPKTWQKLFSVISCVCVQKDSKHKQEVKGQAATLRLLTPDRGCQCVCNIAWYQRNEPDETTRDSTDTLNGLTWFAVEGELAVGTANLLA